jgi:cysteine-rich repeat protein
MQYVRLFFALVFALAFLGACFDTDTNECTKPDGNAGVVCPNGSVCTFDGTSCRPPESLCGNGMVDGVEMCDDGNVLAQDGCSANCLSDETCGNGVVDTDMPFNATDFPARCLDSTTPDTQCAEVCDLGPNNNVPGSGCSPNCLSNESCGNLIVDSHLPNFAPLPLNENLDHPCLTGENAVDCREACDDGNDDAGDDCSPNCLSTEVCSNGITDPGETCDDGDTDDASGCHNDCQSGASCGDGLVDQVLGEQCDDVGESVRCDGPTAEPASQRCTARICGDGYINSAMETVEGVLIPAEACDPGTIGENVPGCDRDCTLVVCGDGITNLEDGEECDDGVIPPLDGDGCSAACLLEPYSLGITKVGDGEGTVTTVGVPGIDCGTDCFQPYSLNAMVTLHAMPAAQSTFDTSVGPSSGWDGCDTVTLGGDCQVTMMMARAVTATFERNVLTVVRDGAGTGNVTSDVAHPGIDCGADCDQAYDVGAMVTLTAAPDPATSELEGWSEPTCPDNLLTCTVTMMRARSVTATFRRKTFTLTLQLPGTGDGRVTVSDGTNTFVCLTDCTHDFLSGASMTLFATAEPNSDFTGWSGPGPCTGVAHCNFTMTVPTTVDATFTLKTFTLTVTKSGAGSGTVSTTPPDNGVDCGADCNHIYDIGTPVALRGVAAIGSRFVRWTGDCSGTDAMVCPVTMAVNRNVNAEFVQIFALNVSKVGNGTVTSNPTGIACGATCSTTYDGGTSVQLTAEPDPGWRFGSWSGCASTSGNDCTVNMTALRNVTATFIRVHVLTVTKTGTGTGDVNSNDGLINCGTGAGCTATYDDAATLQLTQTPLPGSRFTGWTNCTSVVGQVCHVTMSAARTVTANFEQEFLLTVTRTGSGSGTVTTVSPATGINCGADCTETFVGGTSVTVEANAAAGSRFVAWSGGCTPDINPARCTASMTAARSVTAEFRSVFALNVSKVGNGSVASNIGGIACGATCSATYDVGTDVILTATEDAGWRFTGWSGVSGCGTSSTCQVTMSQTRNVTATFVQVHALIVTKTGSGAGTVTASPAGNPPGITAANCGPAIITCPATFDQNEDIVLTASPSAGSRVVAWTGDCTSTTSTTCTIDNIAALRNVSVEFAASFTVNVVRNGSGAGSVSATGINCGSDCSTVVDGGTSITLTAAASDEDAFTAWTGGGCAPDLVPPYTCTFTVTADTTVTATFDDNILSVETTGDGSGTVTSSSHSGTFPINCSNNNGNCEESYDQPTVVTLTANDGAGSRFVQWTGCTPLVADPEQCTVTMNGPTTVAAEFRSTEQLTLTKSSAAGGTLVATQTDTPPPPADLTCGLACTTTNARFDDDSEVVITATPATGFIMGAWTGCDSFTATTCTVTMSMARSVSVVFTPTHLLTVQVTGSGTVDSAPGGITCPGDCTEAFAEDTDVTLVATPDPGWTVAWTGCATMSGNTCEVTMDAAKSVMAVFTE